MPVRVEVVDRGSTGESGLISAFERNNEREHRRHEVKDAWRRDKPTKYRFARRCAHKEPRQPSLAATARHAASWCFRDCVVPKSCVVSGGFINAEAPLLKFHSSILRYLRITHFLSSTASGRPTVHTSMFSGKISNDVILPGVV